MGKTSKEKIMEKMANVAVAPSKPTNSGNFSVRWERREVDGKKKIFLSIEDYSERDFSKPEPPRKEYTDKDEFMSIVAGKIGNFIKEAG